MNIPEQIINDYIKNAAKRNEILSSQKYSIFNKYDTKVHVDIRSKFKYYLFVACFELQSQRSNIFLFHTT